MVGQNPQEEQVFSVSQITSYIKDVLEATFRNLTIEGEISNYKPSAAGHHYFTLKDSGAQISAVMFKGSFEIFLTSSLISPFSPTLCSLTLM